MAMPLALRVAESEARVYRRVWRGSIFSSFFNPILYLLAMGLKNGGEDSRRGPRSGNRARPPLHARGCVSQTNWSHPGGLMPRGQMTMLAERLAVRSSLRLTGRRTLED